MYDDPKKETLMNDMDQGKQDNRNKKLIIGIGSALIDILINEDDDFLVKTGAVKGGMTLVHKDFIDETLKLASDDFSVVPGGSACNTIVGVGKLGGPARFVGKSGMGEMGSFFENELEKNKVDPVLFKTPSPTGRVLSIITPDAQRSMFTFLGASSEIKPEEIMNGCFDNAAVVHIEGYLLFNEQLMFAALNSAKQAGSLISLDLASFTVVEESRKLLEEIVSDFVDILIANEDEALAFTGYTDEIKAVKKLSEKVDIGVLKVGENGSYLSHQEKVIKIEAAGTGCAVDTTGAGDLWASGFLFGLVNGYPLEKCGELGSACGYEVCRVVGASIPEEGWQRIYKLL